jgi:methionine synthase II (cobalamin-independent)
LKAADVFMPAASPASIEAWQVNRYYKTDEECLYAIAEAMREEYEAIAAAASCCKSTIPASSCITCCIPT